ncbi:MAG: SdpI family protein [Pseudomonadota bacterium]
MTQKTANLLSLVLIAAGAVAGALAYPHMADTVPTHWNAAGEVDGYSSKLTGVLIGPVGALGMCLLMWIIPRISPKGFRTHEFAGVIHIFQVALVLFMLAVGGLIVLSGLGQPVSTERVIPLAVGLLLIVIGNYAGKLRKNFFVGIRTPWTLASDEVWARTHRMAGYCFVAAGAGLMIVGVGGLGMVPMVALSVAAGLLPVAYSFVLYQRLEGFDHADE